MNEAIMKKYPTLKKMKRKKCHTHLVTNRKHVELKYEWFDFQNDSWRAHYWVKILWNLNFQKELFDRKIQHFYLVLRKMHISELLYADIWFNNNCWIQYNLWKLIVICYISRLLQFSMCFNVAQSWWRSLSVKQLNLGETLSNSACHPDPSCLHMAL